MLQIEFSLIVHSKQLASINRLSMSNTQNYDVDVCKSVETILVVKHLHLQPNRYTYDQYLGTHFTHRLYIMIYMQIYSRFLTDQEGLTGFKRQVVVLHEIQTCITQNHSYEPLQKYTFCRMTERKNIIDQVSISCCLLLTRKTKT